MITVFHLEISPRRTSSFDSGEFIKNVASRGQKTRGLGSFGCIFLHFFSTGIRHCGSRKDYVHSKPVFGLSGYLDCTVASVN